MHLMIVYKIGPHRFQMSISKYKFMVEFYGYLLYLKALLLLITGMYKGYYLLTKPAHGTMDLAA